MRLLVTGGAGYIGSVVTSQLLRAGHQVVVLDDLTTRSADAIPRAPSGFSADPSRRKRVFVWRVDA